MTIVESALERARELGEGIPPRTGAPAVLSPVSRFVPPPPVIGSGQPQTRIRPHALQVDAKNCRENRLLLSGDEGDEGAIAAYRMLRTRLLHRIRAQKWTTIGVTSTGPGDGKTLTALNLSFSLAREKNSEVVLLDLDMRNPSICTTLGVTPPREMSDFFERQPTPQDMFFSIGMDNLMIAGQVTPAENSSELLASNCFEELISHIKQSAINPVILIDLPPVLVTDDALVLAPRLDALLLVVSEGQTDRGELDKAIELLSEFQLAGVVLNRASDRGAHDSYGYAANYGYGPRKKR